MLIAVIGGKSQHEDEPKGFLWFISEITISIENCDKLVMDCIELVSITF